MLRQLSQLDAQNPVWREDLTTYERERQRQLHKEVTAASEAGNLALLTSLDEELRGDPWLKAPPQGLLNRATDARTRIVRQSARGELDQLAAAIAAAHRRSNLAEARKLRRRWQSAAQTAQLRADDALARQLAPTLDWINQQDRQEAVAAAQRQGIADLEAALLHGAPLAQLDEIYRRATPDGRPLPAELEQKYRAHLAALERSAARRRRWSWAAGLLLTAGTCAAAALFVLHQTESSRIAAAAATLAQQLDEGKLDEAQEFADRLAERSPEWAADSRIASQVVRIGTLKQEEADRHAAFKTSLTSAEAAGADKPDQESLARARSLVRTPAETARRSRSKAGSPPPEPACASGARESCGQRSTSFRREPPPWPPSAIRTPRPG